MLSLSLIFLIASMSNSISLLGYRLLIINLHNKYKGHLSISMLYPVKLTTFLLFQISVFNSNNFFYVLEFLKKFSFLFFYSYSNIFIEIINAHAAICEGL